MGVLVIGMNFIGNVWVAAPFLVLLGGLGGFLVVPMNALLQHRGHNLMGAGRSIAVQNFNEQACILIARRASTAPAPALGLVGLRGHHRLRCCVVAGFMCAHQALAQEQPLPVPRRGRASPRHRTQRQASLNPPPGFAGRGLRTQRTEPME
jgi:hypothetical protein